MSTSRGSIRWRLSLAAAVAITVALALAGLALNLLFERQLRRLTAEELDARLTTLISGFEADAPPAVPPETIGGDPRYLSPYSGFYWQIEIDGRSYRSQSLWDTILPLTPEPPPQGQARLYDGAGPDRQSLLIVDRSIRIGLDAQPVRLAAAMSRATLEEAQSLFARDLVPFLTVLGVLLIGASVVQVAVGLQSFARIHRQVEDLNEGRRPRLGQQMPHEVRPLAAAIDGLLDDRDLRIGRARHRATDLAHTLKTPLQALLGESGQLRAAGLAASADAIDEIVGTIRSRVDRELGRARIGREGAADLAEVARKVAAVLRRTPRGDEVSVEVDIPADLRGRIDPYDLTEALGSIAENAMRHATTAVRMSARAESGRIVLATEDDGPGVPTELVARIARRGEYLDSGGTGVGLSLAREIVEAAGGELLLENRPAGFRVTMSFRRV